MRADDDVDRAVGQARRRPPSPPCRSGTATARRTVTGNGRVPLGERVEVLLDEQRRRHQDGDLLAVLHRLERRPHGDLGLAVADVAADQPVHRDRLLHVGLDLVDARRAGRASRRRGRRPRARAATACPGRTRSPGEAMRAEYSRISSAAICLDRLAGAALRLGPVGAAEPVQRRAPRRRRTG